MMTQDGAAYERDLHAVVLAMADVGRLGTEDVHRRAGRCARYLAGALSVLPDDPAERVEALREAGRAASFLLTEAAH